MKKTIYFLIAFASVNVVYGQHVSVIQTDGGKKNTATVTQQGGTSINNIQNGVEGQVTINQSSQTVNDNNITIDQDGNVNSGTLNQSGQSNSIILKQDNNTDALVGGNIANIIQSGQGNTVRAEQVTGAAPQSPAYGNHLSISQTADGGNIEVLQTGTIGGNNAFINQESNYSILRVIENGAYNSANVTQTAGAYNNVYLELDNSGTATSIGNNATLLQSGTGNVFQVRFIGDNNQINVEQVGNNNLLTNAYNSYGIGELRGSNNTVNAIQHGNNLSGFINMDANNSTINVTSVAY